MESKQQELMGRLDELKKYQEEQEQILNAKQISQRALLTGEQIQMYEYLGLSISNVKEISSEPPLNIESENENDFEEIAREDPDDGILSSDDSHVNNYNNELVKEDRLLSPLKNIDEFQDETSDANQVKRPFLKRGVGLTTRFRIPPDAYNLKKLPRYKYADRVRKNLAKNGHIKVKDPPIDRQEPAKKDNKTVKKKEPPLVEAEKQESLDLVAPSNAALQIPPEPIEQPPAPETKIEEWFKSRPKKPQPEILDTPKLAKLPKGMSWAQLLSSNNIADSPIKIDHLLHPDNLEKDFDLNETSLFKLLEERVNNISLDTSMSSIMQLLGSLKSIKNSEENEETLVNPEDPIIDLEASVNLQLEPHPTEANKKIIIDETSDDDDEDDNDEVYVEEVVEEEEHHVRFSDDVEVVEEESRMSTDAELSMTSTPNERQNFQAFKRKLLGHKNVPEERSELKEKSDLLKTKLAELEEEINSLRQQNSSVAKIRQDLEIDRLQLENDREDMMEQMKDDRIKMEMKLHDERLKVEQEKQRLDKMLKNPSKKEREEITKLKEAIEELKEELKVKETRHGSTSARYRSQIKQLEKDNQSHKLELEVVKKDNKKLELENARLRKDTNNKMLQEINRNIAKLAPVETKKQPETAKKPTLRKSEPVMKKRVKSVPALNVQSSSESSDDEQVSSYNSYKQSKENNLMDPVKIRRSDPLKTSTPSSSSADVLAEMKREIENKDGSKDIWYPNGNLKKISADGMIITMLFFNKDIKEQNITEGTIKYYYSETNTWHTTYIDGLEILEHPDGQTEHRYKDGTVEINYPNGHIRITNENWSDDRKEEWRLPDGTNITILKNDSKILAFSNGQREIHTPNHKRREYPDGTIKIAFLDGSFETRYSNGRIRVKDKDGNLLSDTVADR